MPSHSSAIATTTAATAAWAVAIWWCLAGDGVQDEYRAEWQMVLALAVLATSVSIGFRFTDGLRRPTDEVYRAGYDAGYCQGLAAGLGSRDDVIPFRRTTT